MSLSIQVTASLFDQVVDETSVRPGQNAVLGGTPELSIPRPAGCRYMARIRWVAADRAEVFDARGGVHTLKVDGTLVLTEAPLSLEFRLTPKFRLRRMPAAGVMVTTTLGVMLLTILISTLALVPGQVVAANDAWCESWLGDAYPPESVPIAAKIFKWCDPPNASGGGPGGEPGLGERLSMDDRMAEYLERILKKDFDGDANGQLSMADRQYGETEQDDFYMPAGDGNDSGAMGGAKNVGARPVRTENRAKPKPKTEPRPQTLVVDESIGTVVDLPKELLQEASDEVDEAVEEDDETLDMTRERQEDREGWGVKDWYDQKDKARDKVETDVMQDLAKRILKINPDDPEALAILAYYQYLDEDLDGAEDTYDKYIQTNPDDPAGYNNKALVFKRRGDYETEEHLYRVALTLHSDDYTALNNLAVNLGHQHRFDEALAILDQLKTLDPDEPYTDLHRSKVYAEMGKDDEALNYLEKALSGMTKLGTQHAIEFRQDIRVDSSFKSLRKTEAFRQLLWRYYGDDSPLPQ
ncbi:MAG: tetratricopeptide repeat protein [Myxococcota bacterium]